MREATLGNEKIHFQISIEPPERLLRGMSNLSAVLRSVQELGQRVAKLESAILQIQLDPILNDLILLRDGVTSALPHFNGEPSNDPPESAASFLELLRMEIHTILRRYGVEILNIPGEEFDPDLHQVVEIVDACDGIGGNREESENVVTEIRKPGYVFEGRVLRAAEVVLKGRKSEKEK